jgi:hypothetical protein
VCSTVVPVIQHDHQPVIIQRYNYQPVIIHSHHRHYTQSPPSLHTVTTVTIHSHQPVNTHNYQPVITYYHQPVITHNHYVLSRFIKPTKHTVTINNCHLIAIDLHRVYGSNVHAAQEVAKSGADNCSSNKLQWDRTIATFQSVFLSLLYSLHRWCNIPYVSVKPGLFLKASWHIFLLLWGNQRHLRFGRHCRAVL